MPQNGTAPLNYDINNLSPTYTTDPGTANASLDQLQAMLAGINPNDPNASYYQQQLQQSIQEEQNVQAYDNAQQQATNASNQLNQVNSQISKYGNGGPNQAGFQAWLSDFGNTLANPANFQGLGGQKIAAQYQAYGNWVGQQQQQATQLQGQITSLNQGLATDQSNIAQNLTFAQPNFNMAGQQIDQAFGGATGGGASGVDPTGLYASQVQPTLQNIYQTAFDNKTGTMDQLINVGMGNSGAAQKAKGNIDSNALNQSMSELSGFNNAQQQAHNDLASQQQQQQAQYQTQLAGTQSQMLGNGFMNAANTASTNFNNNTQAQTATALNNAETQLQNQKNSDNFLSGITSAMGGLAGTALGGPLGGAVGSQAGALI